MKARIALLIVLWGCSSLGLAQGFVNLNFESAKLTGYSPGNTVPATNAFPGWTVNAVYIIYDDVSLSGNSISIMDTNSPYFTTSIQGKYSALLSPGNTPPPGYVQTISLGQTGTIPLGTKSISFWGKIGGLQITFAGQPLNFVMVGSAASYNIYSADISAYAGDTGPLLFSLPPNIVSPYASLAFLDNIQFSSTPVPEPSTLGLSALGGLFLVSLQRRKSPRACNGWFSER